MQQHTFNINIYTNKQTNKQRQTDRRQESNLCLLDKCDIWRQYFNDFPDNQLTKFRVSIC